MIFPTRIPANFDGIVRYPLNTDTFEVISWATNNGVFELNGGTNTLVIENGVAYMDYSSCPDHVCERKGKIRYAGQTIVCLPNKLTVTIIGETDESVDFMS